MSTFITEKNSQFYSCEKCNYNTGYKNDYKRHLLTKKHLNQQNSTENSQYNNLNYICQTCDFNTCNKNDYNRHILTKKHKLKNNDISSFICECGKTYKERTGLWKHKKLCTFIKEEDEDKENNEKLNICIENKPNDKDDLIVKLLQQNQDLQKSLIELSSKIQPNITNTNSHNKTFNLQFFLNETCKDALNINDFIDSINLQLNDLENTANEGYVNTISNIILRSLKELDINKRPIHCSDLKRETLYIKDNDIWEKENEEKLKIKKAIKDVSNKNISQIPKWIKEHPHFSECNHKDNDTYLNLIMGSMNGSTKEEQDDNINKIIKNLSKEVTIEKKM